MFKEPANIIALMLTALLIILALTFAFAAVLDPPNRSGLSGIAGVILGAAASPLGIYLGTKIVAPVRRNGNNGGSANGA